MTEEAWIVVALMVAVLLGMAAERAISRKQREEAQADIDAQRAALAAAGEDRHRPSDVHV